MSGKPQIVFAAAALPCLRALRHHTEWRCLTNHMIQLLLLFCCHAAARTRGTCWFCRQPCWLWSFSLRLLGRARHAAATRVAAAAAAGYVTAGNMLENLIRRLCLRALLYSVCRLLAGAPLQRYAYATGYAMPLQNAPHGYYATLPRAINQSTLCATKPCC